MRAAKGVKEELLKSWSAAYLEMLELRLPPKAMKDLPNALSEGGELVHNEGYRL